MSQIMPGGNCLEHIEDRRCDEVYLNAVGAQRIPDPTTTGDFCRRFMDSHVLQLMNAFNRVREKVWKQHCSTSRHSGVYGRVLDRVHLI
jgi:hypothetical protein